MPILSVDKDINNTYLVEHFLGEGAFSDTLIMNIGLKTMHYWPYQMVVG